MMSNLCRVARLDLMISHIDLIPRFLNVNILLIICCCTADQHRSTSTSARLVKAKEVAVRAAPTDNCVDLTLHLTCMVSKRRGFHEAITGSYHLILPTLRFL